MSDIKHNHERPNIMTKPETLEEKLDTAFTEFNISQAHQDILLGFLEMLKQSDRATYEHSIRVSLLGIKVAKHVHSDPKPLLYAGIVHDVGKAFLESELLRKKEFTSEDMETMRAHPRASYELVKDVFAYSAEIALRHHTHQANGYPSEFPDCKTGFSESTKNMQNYYSRILSLVDFYDAIVYRPNNKFRKEGQPLTHDEIKKIILDNNPDQTCLINELYERGIYTHSRS